MKFFTDESFRNKLLGLLGALVLLLSQSYLGEVIGSKDAYKNSLYRNFELYIREMESLDIYLNSLKELKSFDEIEPVYIEDSLISLFEYNNSQIESLTKSFNSSYIYDAVYEYEKINKNLDLIRGDNLISDSERIYIDKLYDFNNETLNYAKKLIDYDYASYEERKKLEKDIYNIYRDYSKILLESYEKSNLKDINIVGNVNKTEDTLTKESVRDKLAVISKRVTGLDTLSYLVEPDRDESYCWSFTTKKDPKALDRSDEDVYTFDYILEENKVYFYQSVDVVVNDKEIKLTENELKALADEHIKKIGLKVEFASSEKNKYVYTGKEPKRDFDYMAFYYDNNENEIYSESEIVKVTVEKSGRLESTFSLFSDEPTINWADESLIKEKFNNESKIQSIIKVVNSKNEGEFLVMTKEEDKLYIYVYDGESTELKLYDKLDKDRHPFYHRILM